MTTANKITIARILLAPFFVAELILYLQRGYEPHRLAALGLFLLIAIGDGVDGFVARRFNQKTQMGALLDPIADKLLLVFSLIILSLHNQPYLDPIPIWLTITVLLRDVVLLLFLVLVTFLVGHGEVRPHLLGKGATVLQMTCVVWTMAKLPSEPLPYLAAAATALTAASGIIYVRNGLRMLRAPKPS
ncbi:MAG: CDP-alcohol phosphatidyltransferase family protein [Verrucomicrobia bacterium]|nr:CDP-alcohol phosphatidyltransferase family protein [Verrucomicrobiota bacterium]